MAPIPVICNNCRRVWVAENIFGGTATGITMVGNTVAPCPRCGGEGRIPDGVYDFSDTVTTYFADPSVSVADLQKLVAVFKTAQAQGQSVDEIADYVEQELPTLAGLAAWLRRAGPVLTEKVLLPLLIGVLLLIVNQRMSQPTITPDQVEQIITRVVEETNTPVPEGASEPPHRPVDPS